MDDEPGVNATLGGNGSLDQLIDPLVLAVAHVFYFRLSTVAARRELLEGFKLDAVLITRLKNLRPMYFSLIEDGPTKDQGSRTIS